MVLGAEPDRAVCARCQRDPVRVLECAGDRDLIVGFLYLFTMATAIFAFHLRNQLIAPGDAVQTASSIVASERLFRIDIASDPRLHGADVHLRGHPGMSPWGSGCLSKDSPDRIGRRRIDALRQVRGPTSRARSYVTNLPADAAGCTPIDRPTGRAWHDYLE